MARINRMTIQGIRSFGPHDEDTQCIRFMSPLTLILGNNGCGKTTIIESLKYASTGDMPPGCNKGQSFVHDPKIASVPEVRGQVKLELMDFCGKKVVVSRSMQATQRAKKIEFKTIDSTITRYNENGEQISVSGRCVDIDLEMCTVLGVAKPIINNVIFCHQEDSNWPLDEGKRLKEKFDAIFDTVKYNKCLDRIRMIKKGHATGLKVLKNDLVHKEAQRKEADLKEQELHGAEQKMVVNRKKVEELNRRLAPIRARLEEIHARDVDISKLYIEKGSKEASLEGVRKLQQEIRDQIQTEFVGSTPELEAAIDTFQQKLGEKKEALVVLESQVRKCEGDETRVGNAITKEQVEIGRLEKDVESHRDRVESRNLRLRKLAQQLELPALPSQPDEPQVAKLMEKVDESLLTADEELLGLRVLFEGEEQTMQGKIDSLRDQTVQLKKEISLKEGQILSHKSEARKVTLELKEVESSASKLVLLEKKLEKVNLELDEVVASVNVDTLKGEIERSEVSIKRFDEQLTLVDKEVKVLQQQSSLQTELDMKNESKAIKDGQVRKLRKKHQSTLVHLLKVVPDQGIKYELQSYLDQLTRNIKDSNTRLNEMQRGMATLEATHKHQKEQLRSKEEILRGCEEQIDNSCGSQQYDQLLKRVSDEIQELQDAIGTVKSSEFIYRRYIKKLQQSDPCCPLCDREFDADEEAIELVHKLNGKMRDMPSIHANNKEKLEKLQNQYQQLVQLKPTQQRIATLQDTEIPALRTQLEKTESQLKTSRSEVETIQASMVAPQVDEATAKRIQGDVVLLDQQQAELRKLDKEVEQLLARLPAGGSGRSLQEAQTEQDRLRLEEGTTRRRLDAIRTRLTCHTDRVNRLREHKNSLVEQQLKIQGGVAQKAQLEEKLMELQLMETTTVVEVDALTEQLQPAINGLEVATRERIKSRADNRDRIDAVTQQLSERRRRAEEVSSLQSVIKEGERKRLGEKLAAAMQSLAALQQQRTDYSSTKQMLVAKINILRNNLASHQTRERDLEDNRKLRQKLEEEAKLLEQIQEVSAKLGTLRIETVLQEKNSLRNEEEKCLQERSQMEGRQNELHVTISKLKDDLNRDFYKNARAKYMKTVYEVKVEECVVHDLELYYSALEWSMMHFHKERMEQINTIVRELWRLIYRGNDIDYIEIKTDIGTNTGMDKRRTYNYRVVQMKGEVELDMRGRCSAGQKVLASLIIRLALAETFSANCSVLALDEPTTNLDRTNIESLCNALVDVINSRPPEKRLQLIIISHDSDFLELLSRVDMIDHYLEVTRNHNGNSIITKKTVDR